MSAAPRFLVSGYYGFGNTGDEAILAGLVEGFQELCPAAELTVLSGSPADTMAEHGVIAVPRGLWSVRRQVKLCDALISGGGGLLQDVTSWRSPLYYLAAIHLAKAARRPVACIGQSIGPLERGWVRALARREIARADAIGVRDDVSRRALTELGVDRPAQTTADLAFLLPRPTGAEIAAAREKAGLSDVNERLAAVALRPLPHRRRKLQVSGLALAVDAACRSVGLCPLLIPMHPSQDVEFARAVAAEMPMGARVAPMMRAREVLALVASCDLVIAMRLHALIFATLCSVPPVAISYDPKVDGLMEQLGLLSATCASPLEHFRLLGTTLAYWDRRADIHAILAARLPHLRSLALCNVELALSVLPRR